jgi:hypothetical protein
MSVTDLPSLSVIVGDPLEYEPPTRPIFAAVFVTDTSLNVGSDAGKDSLTATLCGTSLTAIVAFDGLAAGGPGGAVGVVPGADGVFEGPEGVFPPPGVGVVPGVVGGAVGVAGVAAAGVSPTCWMKGFLVRKRPNVIS